MSDIYINLENAIREMARKTSVITTGLVIYNYAKHGIDVLAIVNIFTIQMMIDEFYYNS